MRPDDYFIIGPFAFTAVELIALAVGVLVLVCTLEELWGVARRRAARRELQADPDDCRYVDPGAGFVRDLRPCLREPAEGRRFGEPVSPMLALSAPLDGVVLEGANTEAYVSRRLAVERELAAEGRRLDELQIEEVGPEKRNARECDVAGVSR